MTCKFTIWRCLLLREKPLRDCRTHTQLYLRLNFRLQVMIVSSACYLLEVIYHLN